MPALLHHAVFTDLHFMCNCNSVSLGMRDDGLVQSTPSVAIPRCGLRVMPWHPPEGTPSHPPRRVRTVGHPIYRPALPYLSAWGNRSSSVFGCPSNAADGTEQGLVFVGWPNRVPGGRLAESWISVLITLEITLNFVLRSARELVVHGPHAPRNPVEIRD